MADGESATNYAIVDGDLGGKTIGAETNSALTLFGTGLIWPAMNRVVADFSIAKRRRRSGAARARVHA